MKKLLYSVISFSLLFIISCSSSKIQNNVSDITSNHWELITLSGKVIDKNAGIPNVRFTSDNVFKGYTGCNEFTGTYKYEGGKLTLDQGIMTKMYCADSPEMEFLTAVKKVTGFKIAGEELVMLNGTTELMKFIPKK
jgi:heat shock protein HslJ